MRMVSSGLQRALTLFNSRKNDGSIARGAGLLHSLPEPSTSWDGNSQSLEPNEILHVQVRTAEGLIQGGTA